MPRVSVIIPTYQLATHLGEAIESVLLQTYRDFEIIVVDDGSTDDTAEILNRLAGRILALRQPHKGIAAARNAGIRASRGQFIAFLDADDVWLPDKLQRQVPLLERDGSLGLVYSDVLFFDEQGVLPYTAFDRVPPVSGYVHAAVFSSQCFLRTSAIVVKRECLVEAGLFDETLSVAEDVDLWLKISKKWALGYVSEALTRYRLSAGQASRNTLQATRDILRVQERAFFDSPDLRALDLATLDRCFYDNYLHLSVALVKQRDGMRARSVLGRYARTRGRTSRWWFVWLASWIPGRLLTAVLAVRTFRWNEVKNNSQRLGVPGI